MHGFLQTNRLYTVYSRIYLHGGGGGEDFELPQGGSQASRSRLISRIYEGKEEEEEHGSTSGGKLEDVNNYIFKLRFVNHESVKCLINRRN